MWLPLVLGVVLFVAGLQRLGTPGMRQIREHEGCPTALPGPARWAALVFKTSGFAVGIATWRDQEAPRWLGDAAVVVCNGSAPAGQTCGVDLQWRAAGWSADLRPFPDDPNVARARLKPIHGCREITRRRLGRPALAHASDLAAALQVL